MNFTTLIMAHIYQANTLVSPTRYIGTEPMTTSRHVTLS